jgi:hypothetical protein
MIERVWGDVLWDPGSGREVVVTGASFGMVTVSDLKTYEKATAQERKFDLWQKSGVMCPNCETVPEVFVGHECSRKSKEGRKA